MPTFPEKSFFERTAAYPCTVPICIFVKIRIKLKRKAAIPGHFFEVLYGSVALPDVELESAGTTWRGCGDGTAN